MSSIIEYPDLGTLITDIKDQSRNMITFINTNVDGKYTKGNGYKIFWITIDKTDPFFEPDDYHGDRIYTILSPRFKDCKSIVIPIYDFTASTISNTDLTFFKEYIMETAPFNVYVGNGYINIIVNSNVLDWFFNEKYSFNEGSSIGFILISDGMYKNRSDALYKLLSLMNDE